jgi:hypothetical protein
MTFEQFRMWLDIFADASVPVIGIIVALYIRKFVNKVVITISKKNGKKVRKS